MSSSRPKEERRGLAGELLSSTGVILSSTDHPRKVCTDADNLRKALKDAEEDFSLTATIVDCINETGGKMQKRTLLVFLERIKNYSKTLRTVQSKPDLLSEESVLKIVPSIPAELLKLTQYQHETEAALAHLEAKDGPQTIQAVLKEEAERDESKKRPMQTSTI